MGARSHSASPPGHSCGRTDDAYVYDDFELQPPRHVAVDNGLASGSTCTDIKWESASRVVTPFDDILRP
ncbi:MAG: hypothetical protein ABI586_11535, partial [Candidatus Nanopelagicales bacterium]